METNPPTVWYVGQPVLCIDDVFPSVVMDWCDHLPVAGEVYTIRSMGLGSDGGARGAGGFILGFLLEEFVNPPSSLGCEGGFKHTRFKPLVEATAETVRQAAERVQQSSTQSQEYETGKTKHY